MKNYGITLTRGNYTTSGRQNTLEIRVEVGDNIYLLPMKLTTSIMKYSWNMIKMF